MHLLHLRCVCDRDVYMGGDLHHNIRQLVDWMGWTHEFDNLRTSLGALYRPEDLVVKAQQRAHETLNRIEAEAKQAKQAKKSQLDWF